MKNFNEQFENLIKLWKVHLTTSKEEVDSTSVQLKELKQRTDELEKLKDKKREDFENRQQHNKEAK